MATDISDGRTAEVWARVERGETVEGLLDIWDFWHVLISQLPAVEAASLVRYLAQQAPARDLVLLSLERMRAVSPLERVALVDVLAAAVPRLKTQRWRFMLQCAVALSSLVRLEFDLANPARAEEEDSDEEEGKAPAKAPRFAANVLNEPRAAPAKDTDSATAQWQAQMRLFAKLHTMSDALSDAERFVVRGIAFRLLANAITMQLPVDVEPIALALLPAAIEPHLLFSPEATVFVPYEEGEEEEVFPSWPPEGVAYAASLLHHRLPVVLSRRFLFRLFEPHVNALLRIGAPGAATAAAATPAAGATPAADAQGPSTRTPPADPHALGEALYTSLLQPLVGRDPPLALPPLDEKAVEEQTGEAGRLQALINFIVNCPTQTRRTALWKGVRGQVSLYDEETRLRLTRHLLKHCPYGHVSALLFGWVKDELARAPRTQLQSSAFVRELRSFFPIVFQSLRPGAELEHFDQLMAAANFARFLLLWDQKNAPKVLNEAALRELSDIFLGPLRMSLTAQLASPLPTEAHRTNLQVLADVCDRTLELLRPIV